MKKISFVHLQQGDKFCTTDIKQKQLLPFMFFIVTAKTEATISCREFYAEIPFREQLDPPPDRLIDAEQGEFDVWRAEDEA